MNSVRFYDAPAKTFELRLMIHGIYHMPVWQPYQLRINDCLMQAFHLDEMALFPADLKPFYSLCHMSVR